MYQARKVSGPVSTIFLLVIGTVPIVIVFVFINKKRLLFILDIQLKPLPALNGYISYLIFI